jgi:3-hydroxyisobutyrate dehydrogenase-like beta-hydroxyacid dehydrogenase
MQIGFIGLGNMGAAIAANLVRARPTFVPLRYDRNQ